MEPPPRKTNSDSPSQRRGCCDLRSSGELLRRIVGHVGHVDAACGKRGGNSPRTGPRSHLTGVGALHPPARLRDAPSRRRGIGSRGADNLGMPRPLKSLKRFTRCTESLKSRDQDVGDYSAAEAIQRSALWSR
jgi:hypothetical protein